MDPAWINSVGLPTAFSIAIGYGIWSCCQWIAAQLIIPMRDRHFEFLYSLSSTLSTIARTQDAMLQEVREVRKISTEGYKPAEEQP